MNRWRSFSWITLCTIGITLFTASLLSPVYAKNAKKQVAPQPESRRFFAFDEAPYFTSKDKRIGAKLLIDSTKVGPTLAAMQNLTYLPGAHVPSHRHVYVTEIIYVLKGNLTLRIDKETKVMGPDATAYIPPQTFHEYANKSQDICQFLQFYAPSGPEEEYRNWDIPGAENAKLPQVQQATGPQIISAPPVPAVPGSPKPVLGTVVQADAPAPKPVIATSTSSLKLELKSDKTKPASATLQLRNKPPVVHPPSSKPAGGKK